MNQQAQSVVMPATEFIDLPDDVQGVGPTEFAGARRPAESPEPTEVEDLQELRPGVAQRVLMKTFRIKAILEWIRLIEARGPYGSTLHAQLAWRRLNQLKKPLHVVQAELAAQVRRGGLRAGEDPFEQASRFWKDGAEILRKRFGKLERNAR